MLKITVKDKTNKFFLIDQCISPFAKFLKLCFRSLSAPQM